MTGTGADPTGPADRTNSEAEIARELRLRPDPPRVMRLSRRAVAIAVTIGGLGLGAILIVALQGRDATLAPAESVSTDHVQAADGLSALPRDYADVPRLGPPLPGYLGRPALSAQDRGEPLPAAPAPVGPATPDVDPDEQRRLQEIEAARLSALFAEAQTVSRAAATPAGPAEAADATSWSSSPAVPGGSDAVAGREAFLTRSSDRATESAERLTPPTSPYVLQAGSVIPAALITGLRSDLPGQIAAQVTSPVYDSLTGRYLLIPQGARLIGEYDSRVAAGQSRLLLVWTRLILPDGRSIRLEREPGADAAGVAGLQDRIDRHWGQVFLAAGLATILNLGLEVGARNEDDVARAIRDATQDTVGRTGEEIVARQLAVPPTLTIRPGLPVRIMVTRDLILEPLGEVR
jgi:type IV secretion system protein VirB10